MKCSICNKTITMNDWLNQKNIVQIYYAHWMEVADAIRKDEYAHKCCVKSRKEKEKQFIRELNGHAGN